MKTQLFLLLIIVLASCVVKDGDSDTMSYSDYLDFDPQKIDLTVTILLDEKFIKGYVRHRLIALQKDIKTISFDIGKDLQWSLVTIEKSGDKIVNLTDSDISIVEQPLSNQLNLKIGSIWSEIKKGEEFYIDITYYTTFEKSKYIVYQNDTDDGATIQYFYVMCKPFCRDLFPLFDTPLVKVAVSVTIEHLSSWTYFSSGTLVSSKESLLPGYIIEEFDQGKQIPAYAITIYGTSSAVKIHDTEDTYIVCSPELAESLITEFKNSVQSQINAIEVYLGQTLPFDKMQLIFPPKSFPYFDLEAGYTSYVSKTVLTGDGNETYNVARTVARQYFGSSIVAQNWSNIFIVEGLVAFMERKVIELTRGEEFAETESMLGNHSLYMTMLDIGMDNEFTKLLPQFAANEDPFDYQTDVPREKGYQLFKEIEYVMNSASPLPTYDGDNSISIMQQFLRDFVTTYLFTNDDECLDYNEFRNYWWDWIFNHLTNPTDIIAKIDYQKWVEKPGLPPVKYLNFDNELYEEIRDLAEVFLELGGAAKPNDWDLLEEQQSEYFITFLDYMIDNYKRVTSKIYKQLDKYYQLSNEKDLELASLWFSMAIASKQTSDKIVLQKIQNFLGSVGRLELISPVYIAFNLTSTSSRQTGCDIYKTNSAWLHPQVKEFMNALKCPLT